MHRVTIVIVVSIAIPIASRMKISVWNLIASTVLIVLLAYHSVAVVFSDFDRFRRACPSTNVNAWKVKVDGECLLTVPAHVAVHPDVDGNWKLSKFLDDFKELDWRIRHSYSVDASPYDDICWAKFHGDDTDALELEDSEIVDPTKAYVIFRQPYDMDAAWVSPGSEMGLTEAIVYRTPKRALISGNDNVPDRRLLEFMDVGFRGMSGAVAVNEDGKCVGMFVKRGKLIPLKPPRLATVGSSTAKTEDTAVPAESATVPVAQPSWLEQLLFPSRAADIARTDAQFLQVNKQLLQLNKKLEHLASVVLKKEDLPELSVVFDARRGLFLPSTNILSILSSGDEMSIPVKAIIGSKAPEIPRF